MVEEKKLLNFWLVLGILAGFSLLLFLTASYIYNDVLCDDCCSVRREVVMAIVILPLMGVFVGSLTYFFISDRYENRIEKMQNNFDITLKFLDKDERYVVKKLVENGGKVKQNELSERKGLSRVKVSRILKKLKRKGIVEKRKSGMTNSIYLDKELKNLFLDGDFKK